MQKRGVKSTVTDIELDTLRYACEHFNWSDAALRWIRNEIAAESAGPERSGVSYYQVIDGARYDRKVLDDCRAAMQGDGVIEIHETMEIMIDVLVGGRPRNLLVPA